MVNSESQVLPATHAFPTESLDGEQQGKETDNSLHLDDVETIYRARASRPGSNDGWLDTDHYFAQDLPADSYKDGEWKEKYKDLDEIQVNGASRRQWKKGISEIEQIMNRCKEVFSKDDLCREDFVEYFHGANSPLFISFRDRLD